MTEKIDYDMTHLDMIGIDLIKMAINHG